jgi:uncharacterized protein
MHKRRFVAGLALLIILLAGCGSREKEASGMEQSAMETMRQEEILIDDAALLADKSELMKEFYAYNKALLERSDIDFRVVTTLSDEPIDRFTHRTFTRLQKASRSRSGKALLLVINPVQDRVRLEVSQALEPIYTDAMVSYVERKGMVPYFRDNRVAEGAFMMMELIKDRAFDALKGKEFTPPMQSRSVGAGAKTSAKIGQKDPEAKRGPQVAAQSGDTPAQVMRKYLRVLKSHNRNPDLEIYSKATREFFRRRTITEINMDNEIRFLDPCLDKQQTLISPDGHHAVQLVRPPDKHRTCPPYYLVKEEGKWRLDFATMTESLRFDQNMRWYFDKKRRLEGEGIYYAFAFDGYRLDRYGGPHTVSEKEKKPDDLRWGFQCKSWYRPGEDPKELTRCWIARTWPGSPAQVRLGMEVYDYIYAVGEGADRIENVSYRDFMNYMAAVPAGQIATVEVERYRKGEKYPYRVIRRGVAP